MHREPQTLSPDSRHALWLFYHLFAAEHTMLCCPHASSRKAYNIVLTPTPFTHALNKHTH